MRLEIDGGKTNYEGVYAVEKYSKLSVVKSKVSPIMGNFPIIIDITKGGVIDRPGSFVWWMTDLTEPSVFKSGAWWSVEEWCLNKYKPFWDKFEFTAKFRQSKLYELGRNNSYFVDFLKLIWLDLISDRYVLQREVVKKLRESIETKLLMDLDISYDEIDPKEEEVVSTDINLSEIAELIGESSDDTTTTESESDSE